MLRYLPELGDRWVRADKTKPAVTCSGVQEAAGFNRYIVADGVFITHSRKSWDFLLAEGVHLRTDQVWSWGSDMPEQSAQPTVGRCAAAERGDVGVPHQGSRWFYQTD